jgi:hypothetical protein
LGITKCRKSKLDRGLNFVMDSNPKLQKAWKWKHNLLKIKKKKWEWMKGREREKWTVMGIEVDVPPWIDMISRFEFLPVDLVRQQPHRFSFGLQLGMNSESPIHSTQLIPSNHKFNNWLQTHAIASFLRLEVFLLIGHDEYSISNSDPFLTFPYVFFFSLRRRSTVKSGLVDKS